MPPRSVYNFFVAVVFLLFSVRSHCIRDEPVPRAVNIVQTIILFRLFSCPVFFLRPLKTYTYQTPACCLRQQQKKRVACVSIFLSHFMIKHYVSYKVGRGAGDGYDMMFILQ